MTGGGEAGRRRTRAPLRQRSRRRWAIVGGIAAGWVFLEVVTGSVVSATVLLVVIAGLAAAGVGGLRALGITMDHPWIRQMASRPWRDGQDVLKVAMRHLSDVFVVTPNGALLAPNIVELQLNPDDLASLCEQMELGVISAEMTEVYEEQVAEYQARFAGPGRAEVYVTAAGSVPPGRYRLRQGDRLGADAQPYLPDVQYAGAVPQFAYAAPEPVYAGPGGAGPGSAQTGPAQPAHAQLGSAQPGGAQPGGADPGTRAWYEYDPDLTVRGGGMVTMMEQPVPAVPVLRLVTGGEVAETRMSGARAGRGSVELVLPDVPTVSREHAKFTFSDGRWRVTNQGRNGLTLNGVPVAGEQPLSDGDALRWGARPDALLSRVEIS
jgi:hypothetical protein